MNHGTAPSILSESARKLEVLTTLNPFLIDVTLREGAIGSGIGQTLSEKLELFAKLKNFGLKNITLGALNYQLPDEPQVDDDLMIAIRDGNYDRTGCFAMTSPGRVDANGHYVPDISETKLRDYRVPNTLHEITTTNVDLTALAASLRWLKENAEGERGSSPRIYVNIIDGCEGFAANVASMRTLLEFLATQPIDGVSFEDAHGTFMPFQVGAFTAFARALLPPPLKLLVHIHSGAGVENASLLEALLNGADGAWGALTKTGPIIGHASLGELIANLARVGNPHVWKYNLSQLSAIAQDEGHMIGKNRYCLPLSYFRQKAERFMDLVPEVVGATHSHRVCPIVSDPAVIAARLSEALRKPADQFETAHLTQMIRLMRRDLRAEKKVHYDQTENLLRLYERASQGDPS
jgi:hypothetical protein